MRNCVALRLARNPWLASLLLVTLAIRALIPLGYMPGSGGLMLCPGYAPIASINDTDHDDMSGMDMSGAAMPMDHDGKAPSHDSSVVCPFAAAATAFASFHTPTVSAFASVVQLETKPAPEPFIPRSQVPLSRLPRGPPAVV